MTRRDFFGCTAADRRDLDTQVADMEKKLSKMPNAVKKNPTEEIVTSVTITLRSAYTLKRVTRAFKLDGLHWSAGDWVIRDARTREFLYGINNLTDDDITICEALAQAYAEIGLEDPGLFILI